MKNSNKNNTKSITFYVFPWVFFSNYSTHVSLKEHVRIRENNKSKYDTGRKNMKSRAFLAFYFIVFVFKEKKNWYWDYALLTNVWKKIHSKNLMNKVFWSKNCAKNNISSLRNVFTHSLYLKLLNIGSREIWDQLY